MKSLKIFILMTVAIAAGFFAACSDSDPEPSGVSGAQVYFPENIATDYSISDDVSSIAIPVRRIVTDAALNMSVLADDPSGMFNIPSTVSFAAGQEAAELLITFDRTKLTDGQSYPLAFLLNDETNTTPYGNRTLNITVTPWPWEKMGTGKFREGYLGDIFDGAMVEIEVTIHKHKSTEGVYMVEEMFGWPYMTEFFGATQAQLSGQFSYTPSNIIFDCTDPTHVTVAKQWTGITENTYGYGQFMFASQAAGTLANGIITFPNNGLIAELAGLGRTFDVNANGTFRIMFPGAEAVDYSLAAAYGGMKVSPDNTTASAVIDFSYGADVQGISYILASGNVTDKAGEIADQIVAGTIENINVVENFPVGAGTVSSEAELTAAGVYTVVALPKDKSGKLLSSEVSAASFFFPGLGGSSAPDCDITAMMGLVSVNWPEQSAECPDEYSLYFEFTGSELTSLVTWLTTTDNLEALIAETGATEEALIEVYGTDRSDTFMPKINTNGFYGSAWIELLDDTSYTLLVKATNTYGKSAVVKATASTTALSYAGTLVLGRYQMSYSEPEGYACENVFRIHPTENSTTVFLVSGLGDTASSLQWYATFDPAAGTLTLDGTAKGWEDKGNIFGKISSNYDPAGTLIYTWWTFVDPKSDAIDDPLVFTVDATTNQPSVLNTCLNCPIIKKADQSYVGDLCFFPVGTEVTPYTAAEAPSAAKTKIQGIRTNIPFSSVRIPADAIHLDSAKSVNATSFVSCIRTLDVKTATCEPLPRQIGKRTVKMGKMF